MESLFSWLNMGNKIKHASDIECDVLMSGSFISARHASDETDVCFSKQTRLRVEELLQQIQSYFSCIQLQKEHGKTDPRIMVIYWTPIG